MDDLCKDCKNLSLCRQIKEGSCADCADSLQNLAEKSCSFGEKECSYVAVLRKKYTNKECKLLENLKKKAVCPRCGSVSVKYEPTYSAVMDDLMSGAKYRR